MKHFFKRICALILCLLMLLPAALAEDCFTIDVDTLDLNRLNNDDYVARALTASAQGIRIRKYISSSTEVAAAVRLTLTQMASKTLVFDKDYGYQTGTFDSGVIYLPHSGDGTIPYLVTLYIGDYVYAMPFMHRPPRLDANGACTVGVRLRDLDPAQGVDWLMGTMVDLDDLRASGSRTVDICASNSYVIGTATIRLDGSDLSVKLHFSSAADVELEDATLYVVKDGDYLSDVSGASAGSSINVSGADSALIYLPMQVSYDPAGLPTFRYSLDDVRSQQRLWDDAHSFSGGYSEPQRKSDDSSQDKAWDDGWSDGWSDGWDDGWSDGW